MFPGPGVATGYTFRASPRQIRTIRPAEQLFRLPMMGPVGSTLVEDNRAFDKPVIRPRTRGRARHRGGEGDHHVSHVRTPHTKALGHILSPTANGDYKITAWHAREVDSMKR